MAVGIRLTRKGKKNARTYSIVVADTRSRRDGAYIDRIGTYTPPVDLMVIVSQGVPLIVIRKSQPLVENVCSEFRVALSHVEPPSLLR